MACKYITLILLMLYLICLPACRLMVEEPMALPIICFTFDDQHVGVHSVALPIMAQYGYRGSCFVNTGFLGIGSLMTAGQLQDLYWNYNWEIGGHSLLHENLTELTPVGAEHAIRQDYNNLVALGLNPSSFALPRGKIPQDYLPFVYEHYRNVRGSSDFAMHQPIDRRSLGYLPFQSGWNAGVIKDRIMRGITNRESIIIIGFHRIDDSTDQYGANCPESVFSEIMSYVHDKGLEVLPLSEAVEKLLAR